MIWLDLSVTANRRVCVQRQTADSRRRHTRRLRSFVNSSHVQSLGGSVTITGMFDPQNRVHDVNRYRVNVSNSVYSVLPHSYCQVSPGMNCFSDLHTNFGEFNGTIVLLLESPHRDEYLSCDVRCPIAPAQGRAGSCIDINLAPILNDPRNNTLRQIIRNNSRVIIANPIQFQSSLWSIHQGRLFRWRTLRNAVWKTLWDVNQIKTDFCDRLRLYSPDVLINCCTSSLQKEVTDLPHGCSFGIPIYKGNHPSAWSRSTEFQVA